RFSRSAPNALAGCRYYRSASFEAGLHRSGIICRACLLILATEFNLVCLKAKGALMRRHKSHPETESVHGGASLEKRNAPLAQPIYQTSTFQVTDSGQPLPPPPPALFYTPHHQPPPTPIYA